MLSHQDSKLQLEQLIEKFNNKYNYYTSPTYQEWELRIHFVNPFFQLLGWDVDNAKGSFEVLHEDRVIVDEGGKRKPKHPDYGFRIGGQVRFYVETKKPNVKLKTDPEPAFQLRRYGWSRKLTASVLTDFEELAIYDCRIQPNQTDESHQARLVYYKYTDYIARWDEIVALLSHDAVLNNQLDEWVRGKKARGTVSVDDAFLKEMESWRELLAKDIALHNRDLTQRQINMAVQSTIDRIVFLRICEDRQIEGYGALEDTARGTLIYSNLIQAFQKADDKYNSGLFHFKKETGREEPDTLTQNLVISDDTLRKIINRLYYPSSPYEFSVLPSDILGQIYERFLGKVIELTSTGSANVVEKPEVRKAGGVYYTPTYIVDYIVQNTIGELVSGKNPDQVAKLRIVDPACGSGSFLIGAFAFLIEWHRDWYIKENLKENLKDKLIHKTRDGIYVLTTAEKKRILLNNIYGVDLDQQAVEVTKLSLLLKVLEGETAESTQLELFSERVLPDLDSNIKWGNSLIAPDFYAVQQIPMFDEEQLYKVKVFDWHSRSDGFGEIMSAGGFDALIGNPPYVFTKYVEWGEETKDYIQNHYLSERDVFGRSKARQSGKINLFAVFILRAVSLLKKDGLLSYIVPNNILRTTIYDVVRKKLLEAVKIKRIVDLKAGVFANVTASTIILILEGREPNQNEKIEVVDNRQDENIQTDISSYLLQSDCLKNPSYVIDIFTSDATRSLILKLESTSTPLGGIVDVLNGIATHKDMAGVSNKYQDENSKRILFGKDIADYSFRWSGKYIDYNREKLIRARSEDIFLAPEKLIMQRIGGILVTAYDNEQFYTFNSVNNLLLKKGSKYSLKYILGILNSKLLRTYYISRFTNKSSLTVNVSKTFLDQLPIRKINFDNSIDRAQHDNLVTLVDRMLGFQKQVMTTPNPQAQKTIQSLIEVNEREIDELVYELYGLTKEEIVTIEAN